MENKSILTIGGGSGQFALLSGLRDLAGVDITAVVSMFDSGGSTGRLRDELGILPPGDILKCILALSPLGDTARRILLKRFIHDQRLEGHTAGNMLLTMLSRYTGSFPRGVQALAEILDVRGKILPVTIENATLVAELTNGDRIFGEKAIDIPRGTQREKIRAVFLVPHHGDSISVFPPVIDAIREADHILIGPGDIFTSIIPALIVPGVKEALKKTPAGIIYIVNIMTKFGETQNFKGSDFVQKLEGIIERKADHVIFNTGRPENRILEKYAAQKAELVEFDSMDVFWRGRRIYTENLLETANEIVRHNSKKLAGLITAIIASGSKIRTGERQRAEDGVVDSS